MEQNRKTDKERIVEALQSGNFNFNKIIQLEDFQWVLKSILDIGDKNSEWKADLVEFINSDSSGASTGFFYDMLPFVRFVDEPANQSAAYTTPDHRIWMNAPQGFGIGKEDYKWEFIYYHECMHQLWDTFDVQKNIEKEFGQCDMEVLNIASDCVINDFLHVNKKMPYPTAGLITPEYVRDHYGVEYDRTRDTQFGLYEKLMKVAEKIHQDMPPKQPNTDSGKQGGQGGQGGQSGKGGQQQQGQSGQQSGQSGNSQGGSQQSSSGNQNGSGKQSDNQDPNSVNDMNASDAASAAQDAADRAKKAADIAKAAADAAKKSGDSKKAKELADKAKAAEKAAKDAQKAADKAKKAAQKGDEKGARDAAKEAIEKANEAEKNAKQATGDSSQWTSQGGGGNQDQYSGVGSIDDEPTADYFKKLGDQTIRKWAGKVAGEFGQFVKKCRASETEQKHEGIVVRQRRGAAWNKALDRQMDTFIHQQVIAMQRETEPTYHRVKRGTRPVRFGDPIQPGQKIKDDKLNITVAFYIDRSGSMGDDSVQRCFDLAYQLSDKIRKNYSSEKVVGEIGFRYFAFNDYMKEVPKGQTVRCDGCTMSLKEILNFIEGNTSTDLVNIIITDAEFSIDKTAVVNLVKKMPGMFFLISNQDKPECDGIAKALKGQFVYLKANAGWEME